MDEWIQGRQEGEELKNRTITETERGREARKEEKEQKMRRGKGKEKEGAMCARLEETRSRDCTRARQERREEKAGGTNGGD